MAATNIKTGAYLKSIFNKSKALGDPVVQSDAYMEIDGFEDFGILFKQFPHPELSSAGEIEVPMPWGSSRAIPQQLKIYQQGPVQLIETQAGHIQTMLNDLVQANGARFNAKIYEGTPDDHTRTYRIHDCFLVLDNPDRDFESRAQILLISGTLHFHYFGEV